MIQLIATDLDGTFLDKAGQLTEINQRVFRQAHEMGVIPVFATGRPDRWLDVLDPLKDIDPYAVASNGGLIYRLSDRSVIYEEAIDPDLASQVTDDIRAELGPDVGFAAEYQQGWSRDHRYDEYEDYSDGTVSEIDELLANHRVVKLLVRGFGIPTDELATRVEAIVGNRLKVTFSFVADDGLLEISAPHVSKATAIKYLLNQHHIDPQNMAAFGDMPNDREMLDLAGHGYAMANCHPSLNYLPSAGDNDDSGVGRTVAGLLGIEV